MAQHEDLHRLQLWCFEKGSQLWGKTERQGKLGEQGTDHAYAPVVNLNCKEDQMCSQGTRETIMQMILQTGF